MDFLLEQNGMTRAELAPVIGGRSRVSDFFNGRRQLSLGQIQKLRERFAVSADALLPSCPSSITNEAHGSALNALSCRETRGGSVEGRSANSLQCEVTMKWEYMTIALKAGGFLGGKVNPDGSPRGWTR